MKVQRGNTVIPKSSTESRIKSNFNLFTLDQSDFEAIEGIAGKMGQKRFGNLDAKWGSKLFDNENL